jgi:hypothetical protein
MKGKLENVITGKLEEIETIKKIHQIVKPGETWQQCC